MFLGGSNAEVSAKRYRYTGKERDEETELYYHGARYYAPWLGRWTAADPLGVAEPGRTDLNLYSYVRDQVIMKTDPNGELETDNLDGTDTQPGVSREEEVERRAKERAGQAAQIAGQKKELRSQRRDLKKARDMAIMSRGAYSVDKEAPVGYARVSDEEIGVAPVKLNSLLE